jgi:cytoskeletal protein CcmA (bactofilin family)
MAWGSKTDEGGGSARSGGGGGTLSFIGAEVTITGNVSGDGDIHLDGVIEGDLHCRSLILGAGGRVRGNIAAEKANVAGTVDGTISAGTLTIEKSARVKGDLAYDTLSMENGAQVDGRVSRRGGDSGGLKLVAADGA